MLFYIKQGVDKCAFLFDSYLYSNAITSIKSDSVQQHYEALSIVNIPLICFYNVMTYNTCIHVCIIYVA